MAYAAKILKDSISPDKVRLTTMEVTFPRIVVAEFNTHRMFSRNSASSRAIPVEKMLKKVEEDPFIPIYWGKNQKGMSADEELVPAAQEAAIVQWLAARDQIVERVKIMLQFGIHKQITNRLLEPWLWHTVIVTATEWDNFWGLRCSPEAQPEIRKIADMMRAIYDASIPKSINYGEWHLPLVDEQEAFDLEMLQLDPVKVSIGRCARVSYLTHDGKRDPKADVELCDRLRKSGHMSPSEHAARPMTRHDVLNAMQVPHNAVTGWSPKDTFSGNFRGWIQSRKEMPNEDNFLLAQGR